MESLQLTLEKVHCHECEKAIDGALTTCFTDITSSDTLSYKINDSILIITNTHPDQLLKGSLKKIIKAITKSGFDVVSWELYENDSLELTSHINPQDDSDGFYEIFKLWDKYKHKKTQQQHMKICKACQIEHQQHKEVDSSEESLQTVVGGGQQEFRAVFSISGMTCSSCVGSVSETIVLALSAEGIRTEDSHKEPNYSVDLIQHSAVVIIPNKQIINKIITAIDDAGFGCRLLEVLPVERSVNLKVTALVGGITCAACVNSILSAVNELPFVLDCAINVVTKSATFIMEDDKSNMEKLKETVEDCGFDFEVVSVDQINYTSGKRKSRSFNVSVDGMYCGNCPVIITDYLSSFGEAVVIEDPITLKHPFIKFTYIPNNEKRLNIRRFLFDLNHLKPSDNPDGYKVDPTTPGVFKCNLVQKVSMDEHLRKLARKETLKIVKRLIIATVFTIPTFIFGVVAMSLLPSNDRFRKWVEEPIWAGNVSRNTWILFILSTPVYFFAADIFHVKAFKEVTSLWLRHNTFKKRIFKFGSMNLLISLGTTVAYVCSIVLLILSSRQEKGTEEGLHTTYFDSVVFLSFFLIIGRLLESISKGKTADAISNLGDLKVSEATLLEPVENEFHGIDHSDKRVIDVKFLEVDDLLIIGTGESPPVDCVIMEGSSEFDESALTGESIPVKHHPGHQIFSGTVNTGNGSVVAKIISLDGESLIDQILNTVRDGQLRKAPIARAADAITGYFVPVIVLLALFTWIIWLILAYSGALPDSYLDIDVGGWAVWSLEFSIAVFVIACPCGLGLAAPTALFVGSGLAAKYGILAKGGGVAFQDGANTNVICFDKTGTLTHGDMRVSDYAYVMSDEKDQEKQDARRKIALNAARDLELASKHPIAKSIKSFVESNEEFTVSPNMLLQVESIAGQGLKAEFDHHELSGIWKTYEPSHAIIGNELLMLNNSVSLTEVQRDILSQWKKERKSVSLLAIKALKLFNDEEYHLLLMIGCRDQIRAEAKPVISFLQNKLGMECWMITGDNKLTADAIAQEIGIHEDRVISEVFPEDKQQRIKNLKQRSNNIVAMVGDGINDAPALAAADVGIALASGTDLAVTSSDFILLNKSHPLTTLVTLFDLSKVVFRRVKFNFGWSLVYNCIALPIAAGVIYPYNNSRLNPAWASAAMALSSVSVVTSSLALKLYRPKMKNVLGGTTEADEAVKKLLI